MVEIEGAVLAPCGDGTLESVKQKGQWPAILGPNSSQVNESAADAADVRNHGCDILPRYRGVRGARFADG